MNPTVSAAKFHAFPTRPDYLLPGCFLLPKSRSEQSVSDLRSRKDRELLGTWQVCDIQ